MKKYRELAFDIEATNLKGDVGWLLCASFKEPGKKPFTLRLDDYPDHKKRLWDDSYLVDDIVKVLSETTRVYGHYSSGYDLKFVRTRRVLNGTEVSRPFLHADLYTMRTNFLLHNNRLGTYGNFVAENLKTPLSPTVWAKAMGGDKISLNYIVDHCEKDVEVTEAVYLALEPYIKVWKQECI